MLFVVFFSTKLNVELSKTATRLLLAKSCLMSYNSHNLKRTRGVVVNMPPCHGGDRRFESGRVRCQKLSLPLKTSLKVSQ